MLWFLKQSPHVVTFILFPPVSFLFLSVPLWFLREHSIKCFIRPQHQPWWTGWPLLFSIDLNISLFYNKLSQWTVFHELTKLNKYSFWTTIILKERGKRTWSQYLCFSRSCFLSTSLKMKRWHLAINNLNVLSMLKIQGKKIFINCCGICPSVLKNNRENPAIFATVGNLILPV